MLFRSTTDSINYSSSLIDYGSYFIVDTMSGVFDVSTQPSVDLHCVTAQNVSLISANTYNSTVIGTARLRGLKYVNSNGSNTSSYIFNTYVCDTNFKTVTATVSSSSPTTVTISDTTNTFSNTANAYVGVTLKVSSGVDFGDVRTVSAYSANGTNKTFTVNSAFTVNPSASDQFSLLYGINNVNALTQQNGSYTALTANANISVAGGGKSGITYTSPTVLFNSGSPEMLFPVGYPYVSSVSATNYYSNMLFRNQKWNNTNKTLTLNLKIGRAHV